MPEDLSFHKTYEIKNHHTLVYSLFLDRTQQLLQVDQMEGCVIENHSIVAAGSVVPAGTLIPAGQFWAGNPAIYQRDVSEEEVLEQADAAKKQWEVAEDHAAEFLPHGFSYVEAESTGART